GVVDHRHGFVVDAMVFGDLGQLCVRVFKRIPNPAVCKRCLILAPVFHGDQVVVHGEGNLGVIRVFFGVGQDLFFNQRQNPVKHFVFQTGDFCAVLLEGFGVFTGGALEVGVRPQHGALGRLLHDKLGVVVEVVVGIFVDHDARDGAGLVPARVDQVLGDFAKAHAPVDFRYRELGAIKYAAVEGGVHFATGGEHGRSTHAIKQAGLVTAALAQTQTLVVVKRTNGFVGALAGLGRGDRVREPFQAVLGVELVDQLVT